MRVEVTGARGIEMIGLLTGNHDFRSILIMLWLEITARLLAQVNSKNSGNGKWGHELWRPHD